MAPKIIVSYDDTANDHDALALARVFAGAGADISLAYVRHAHLPERDREVREERDAEELLERGASSIGVPDAPRHVVLNASTGDGLWALAEREGADMIVFGSEYRTAPGAVAPQTSAQHLLEGGPAAIAIAPAGLRDKPSVQINRIGVLAEGDEASEETARSLATALGATVVPAHEEPIDLLVIGSRPEAHPGHVTLSAASQYAIDKASFPVLAVARAKPVQFAPAPVTAQV